MIKALANFQRWYANRVVDRNLEWWPVVIGVPLILAHTKTAIAFMLVFIVVRMVTYGCWVWDETNPKRS